MAEWDLIECDFSAADETINFGTRAIGDCKNLYETSTLASIKNSADITTNANPTINSVIGSGRLYLSINKDFKVFQTLECNEFLFDTAFDEIVDSFCVAPEAELLFVCLRNGSIYGFFVGEDTKYLFAKSVVENTVLEESYFIGCYTEINGNSVKLWLVTKVGRLYSVVVADVLKEETEMDIQVEMVTNFDDYIAHSTFNYPYLFLTGGKITVYDVLTQDVVSDDECSLKKIFAMDKLLMGLQTTGELVHICSETLIQADINTENRYKDFVAIPQYANGHHIIAVTEINELGTSHIQLINCFGFDIIFSLNLTHNSFLITPESVDDEIVYITKIMQNDRLKELQFTRIYETSPEKRLTKLLKKGCLEDAESFAKLYNLDMNIIRKARAQAIVDKTVCNEADIDALLELLNTIKDLQFTLQCCLDVHSCCERLEDVKRVLKYGCSELPSDLDNDDDICAMYGTVSDFLFRFDTYVALLNNSGIEYDYNEWFEFSACDLIQEIISRLQVCNFQESAILYSRLDRRTIHTDLAKHVREILATLDDLTVFDCEPFLHVFIPVSLQLLPSLFSMFVTWLCNKILQIEQKYSHDFPGNAMAFAGTITKLLHIETDTDISKEICELTRLTDGLKQVKILKDDFRIYVPLQKYLEGPKHFIRTLLNIDIVGQDFGSFLQNFLYRYMLDNSLVPDDIFLDEIANLVEYEEKYWVQVVPYILQCIGSLETKLSAILVLMKAAEVPWSKTLSDIFIQALNYSHPLVAKIRDNIENHPARTILHKYNCSQYKKMTFTFLVEKIISKNRSTMLEDIKQLCRTAKQRQAANMILIIHFLETGELRQAFEIIEEAKGEEKIWLCRNATNFITTVINNEFASPNLQGNCYEFLRPVFNQLNMVSSPSLCARDEEIIRSTYKINSNLRKKIKTDHLRAKISKETLKEDLIYEVVQDFQDGNLDIAKSLDMITTISKYLTTDSSDLLTNFCSKLENFTVICKAAERMLEAPSNSRNLCLIAILLLKHIGSSLQGVNQTISDLSETFVPENTKIDFKIFTEGLQLAECIATKAILNANNHDLDACIEVLKWMQTTCFMLTNEMADIKKELYKGIFSSDLVAPSCNSFNAVKNVFNIYVDYMRNYDNPNTKYLMHFNHHNALLTEEQLIQQIKFLPQTIADLGMQGQTLTAFKLMVNLRSSLIYAKDLNPTCLESLNNIIANQCLPQLLQQVMSTRHFDAELAYDLLMIMDVKKVVKYIQQVLVVYKVEVVKFEAVAHLVYKIFKFHKDRSKQERIMNIILTCKWWKKLKNCPMRYEDFFKSTADELAEKLILLKCLTGGLLVDFCTDFKLDVQVLLLTQLKFALIYWKPEYTIETDVGGKRKLLIKNTGKALFEECTKFAEQIVNKEKLFETINNLWPNVNFYYYEVFDALLDLLKPYSKSIDNCRKSQMLSFLKNYTRFGKPNEAEKGEWFTAFPDTQCLDPLSEFRLPFTLTLFTSDVWNLIRPEISLQTYKYWFEAVDILKSSLSKDEICCFVVKQVVTSGALLKDKNIEEWMMYPKHNDLFKDIDVCVQYISDLKAATATVYHLMTNTPQGADLVNAATLCYKYAMKYKEKYPDAIDIQRIYIKVKKQYLSYSAMHILHLNMLAEDRYLKIVSDPNELIDALYMDERIIKRLNSVVLNFPDINRTTDDLAELFGIDIRQKRISLLNNWLCNTSEVDFNSTIKFIANNKPDLDNDVASDNIKRAAYMCSVGDVGGWRRYLLKKGLNESPPECKNYAYRSKVLTCFCMITEPADIFELTDYSKDELLNFIAKLSLLGDLEYQGYNFDVETLDGANKKEILRRLAQNISSPSNVRIMATLCITYNINNLKYWELIVKSATRLNMIKELKDYIEFLKSLEYCSHKQFYIQAWQRVVDNIVSACVDVDSGEAPLEKCVEALQFIQTCPVLYSLKFGHLVEKLIAMHRMECAAVLLQYLSESDRNGYGRLIVKENGDIESVNNLMKYGIWGIAQVRSHLLSLIH